MDNRNTKSLLSTASPIMLDSKGRFSFKRISPHNLRVLESPLVIKEGGLVATQKQLPDSRKGKEVTSASFKLLKSPLPVSWFGANDKEASSSKSSFVDILKKDKEIDKANVNISNQIISSNFNNSNVWNKKPHIKINWNENPDVIGDLNIVKMDMDKEKSNIHVLSKSLVVKILVKDLPFSKSAIELRKQWKKFGGFHLTILGLDWLLCSFQTHEAMEEVLNGGPWFVGGLVVGLDKWSPNFSPSSLEGVSSPIWVRLPHLPLHCWDESNITRIVSRIGTPLLLDGNMFRWGRREFARACIRVNLNSKLPSGIWVEGLHGKFFQKFEYENLSSLCFKCGRIGHIDSVCPNVVIPIDYEIPFGPWMQVQFKNKKNSRKYQLKSRIFSDAEKFGLGCRNEETVNATPEEIELSLKNGNVSKQMSDPVEGAGQIEGNARFKEGEEVVVNQNFKISKDFRDSIFESNSFKILAEVDNLNAGLLGDSSTYQNSNYKVDDMAFSPTNSSNLKAENVEKLNPSTINPYHVPLLENGLNF
ncbi:hypothetical protein KFK09_004888 [Dendrobium nobile]|uniref:CCHC-type domain-containing protein n=1 Tax=Dendrobium nobile TaxID=94219 RepID=A0A8T3BZ76_DENNO|nr:hypothetical protein KFK09_004888 [Dendrobium nobile]